VEFDREAAGPIPEDELVVSVFDRHVGADGALVFVVVALYLILAPVAGGTGLVPGCIDALRERFNDRKTRLLVFELTSLVRLFRQIVTGINVFLAGLAAISLLVAGVAIANTMLMAVIKRREEIGALRAVGYSKRDITRLLLIEATLLGTVGAAVGGTIATAAAAVANLIFPGRPACFLSNSDQLPPRRRDRRNRCECPRRRVSGLAGS
jgi:hypothetical protein